MFLLSNKIRLVLKTTLYSCTIIMILSGIALAIVADRDVIIGFKNKPGQLEEVLVNNHGGIVKKTFNLIPAIAAKLPESEIDRLKKNPRVAYIEEDNKIYRATDEYTNSWGVQHIGSQLVHARNITGKGVKIAILDTGIDYTHQELVDNYKGGYDFVNNDPDPMDDTSHGTHVAGIIAAKKNDIGVVGVAPDSDIYAVKVLNPSGGGPSWVISGLQWAVDNNMNITTMSFGGSLDSISVHNAIDNAYNAGILLIASAGNGGSITYPAAYDAVIAVTATDSMDQNASFSSGPEAEISAPGVGIYSTIIGGGYDYKSGTSMAAPHVAGASALIFSTDFQDVNNDGIKNYKDVRIILQNTSKDLGDVGRDNIFGYGLVDVSNAVLGFSAYIPVDLSITKEDGVSRVVSGDGTIYTYTIYVKNNGTSSGDMFDALGVKVSDIWPIGFTRGIVTTSQGNCDTTSPTNFTCNLGRISKEAIITVNYSVSLNTFEQVYNNEVKVSSTTSDFNIGNNIAIDTNIIGEIKLKLIRKTGPEINDAKYTYLSSGNYLINIKNKNLSKIDIKVYENGIIRKDLSTSYRLNKSNNIEFNIYADNSLKIIFIPYGSKGSTGDINIRKY